SISTSPPGRRSSCSAHPERANPRCCTRWPVSCPRSPAPQTVLLVGDTGPDPHRGETGLVLQDPESQVIFSRVGDDVAFGMENLGLPAETIDSQIRESLAALGLDLRLDHPT